MDKNCKPQFLLICKRLYANDLGRGNGRGKEKSKTVGQVLENCLDPSNIEWLQNNARYTAGRPQTSVSCPRVSWQEFKDWAAHGDFPASWLLLADSTGVDSVGKHGPRKT